MKNRMYWLPGVVVLSGCGVFGIFNTEPFVDAKKDEQGRVIFLDTPRMWFDFREYTDWDIADEKVGAQPPGGVSSWNEHWLSIIQYTKNGSQENAPKYVAYIIESRRKAGLPELKDYP